MKSIISTYEINNQTLALIPAKEIDYDTSVIEKNKVKHVQKTSFQLIEEACVHYWSTYEGRRDAVVHNTNFKQRTPIPVSPSSDFIFSQHTHQK